MPAEVPSHRRDKGMPAEARREAGWLLREATRLLEGSDLRGASEKLEEARSRILFVREPDAQGELGLDSKRESRRRDIHRREAEG